MADKKENGLIGFDPLAWMDDEDMASNKPEQQNKNESVSVTSDQNSSEKIEAEIESSVEDEDKGNDDLKITLDATLNIQNVAVLYEKLKSALDRQNKIEIDASAVTIIDTATLQLLIVLKQTAVKLHKEVIIDFPSDKLIEAAELLGLSEMLEVDQAAAGLF